LEYNTGMNMSELIYGMSPSALRESAQKAASMGFCSICDMEGLPDEYSEGGYWKDALSVKEYKISGMCQSCQDRFFDVQELED